VSVDDDDMAFFEKLAAEWFRLENRRCFQGDFGPPFFISY
jgi:hypothetical protein